MAGAVEGDTRRVSARRPVRCRRFSRVRREFSLTSTMVTYEVTTYGSAILEEPYAVAVKD